jgi:hypothetical protein
MGIALREQSMSHDAERSLVSGATWREFCEQLARAGEIILAPDAPSTKLDRAEGFRYLTRLLRLGLEKNLEGGNPSWPYFYQLSHETAKIGADNPDNVYWNATISGEYDYRITGVRGTMAYFSMISNYFRYELDGSCVSTGSLLDQDIQWDAKGEADIIASATPKPGNWLPLTRDSNFIIIRQSYLDRTREVPGTFRIERIGGPLRPEPLSPEFVHRALLETAAFVRGIAATFADWSRLFRQHPNQILHIDQAMFQKGGGSPDIYYAHGYFQIAADEAWVIRVRPPACRYWNFQVDNWWMESLDYRHLRVAVNKHEARLDPDGQLTLVVAERDVGAGNWLDTAGHGAGTVLLRWVGASEHPLPVCRVVKLDALVREARG